MNTKTPYVVTQVTTPTKPPITWDVVIVAAYADPPAGSPVLLRRMAPLKRGAQDLPGALEQVVEMLAGQIRQDAIRGGLRLHLFHKPHEKLSEDQARNLRNAIMQTLYPTKIKGRGPLIVQPGRNN